MLQCVLGTAVACCVCAEGCECALCSRCVLVEEHACDEVDAVGCILGEMGVGGRYAFSEICGHSRVDSLCAWAEVHVGAKMCVLFHQEVNIHCIYMSFFQIATWLPDPHKPLCTLCLGLPTSEIQDVDWFQEPCLPTDVLVSSDQFFLPLS